jgi:hypothetical protein
MAYKTVLLFLAGIDPVTGDSSPLFTSRVLVTAEFPEEPVTSDCLRSHLFAIKNNPADVSTWATLARNHNLEPLTFIFYKSLPACPGNVISPETSLDLYHRGTKDSPVYFVLPEKLGIA